MAVFDEDGRPLRTSAHEVGSDVSLLSATELDDRIAVLEDEIARLKAEKSARQSSRGAAEQIFRGNGG